MNTQVETLRSFLTFKIGEELFGTRVEQVLEILEMPRITHVPRSPQYMRGVINLRGSVLPVIDSRLKFGIPAEADTINSCIIVMRIILEEQELEVGMVVDGVQEVLELDESALTEAPSIGNRYRSEFIEGMIKRLDHFIMVLDLDKIFSSDEVLILQDSTSTNKTENN